MKHKINPHLLGKLLWFLSCLSSIEFDEILSYEEFILSDEGNTSFSEIDHFQILIHFEAEAHKNVVLFSDMSNFLKDESAKSSCR